MNLLLDTHALLWWATGDAALPAKTRKAISEGEVFVSAASVWEIATKARVGKLVWPPSAGTVHSYSLGQGFRPLSIMLEHAGRAGDLRIEHRDPFDRMFIAQVLAEDLWLVSNESLFDAVGVRRYW